MKRVVCGMIVIVWVGLATVPAQAGWHEFWRKFKRDTARNSAYPEPFAFADREAQKSPFRVMVENGWRTEHTLTETLFTDENQLTSAGERRVHWIVTQSPPERRTVYVISSPRRHVTESRLDSVQQYVTQLIPAGPLPAVVVTDDIPRGGSGDYLNEMHRKYRDSLPAPQLPEITGN
jgi:hypothetical protein